MSDGMKLWVGELQQSKIKNVGDPIFTAATAIMEELREKYPMENDFEVQLSSLLLEGRVL